jgi:hypothetical protein
MKMHILHIGVLLLLVSTLAAQAPSSINNSLRPVGQPVIPAKVMHAEPLYIDLIRDLGARQGEKEWNVGLGLTDNERFDRYATLIEYEFAPINRLGLEIELPFSFYYPSSRDVNRDSVPQSQLNSIKMAAQYSFFVSEKRQLSMAIGYLHEFELHPHTAASAYKGNLYNPFFIAAKCWGQRFHTLLYTGPVIEQHFKGGSIQTIWQINTNLHYMIPHTRNFIGLEINQELGAKQIQTVLRPQMRLSLADNLLVGIVTGIPTSRRNERLSSFIRFIYEPGHRKHGN